MNLTLELAQRTVAAAAATAARAREHMSFAVVDAGGNLVAFSRMDGAVLASIETAIGKAYTAIATHAPTAELFPLTQPGQPLFGFAGSQLSPRPLVPMGGGVPLERDGQVIGGFGAAGSRSGRDHEIATEAAAASGTDGREA